MMTSSTPSASLPSIDSLTRMLGLQDALNLRISPTWLTANFPFTRAIRVEAAELTEHLGWKWWKAQGTDMEQAKLEVVDIWHFMLSQHLVDCQGSSGDAAAVIRRTIEEHDPMTVVDIAGRRFTLNGLTLHESVDVLGALAGLGFVAPSIFNVVMQRVGLTWAELEIMYIGKNVLNLFRAANGYKEGTYIKMWDGAEDNVYLTDYMRTFPGTSVEGLREALAAKYAEVKTHARHQAGV